MRGLDGRRSRSIAALVSSATGCRRIEGTIDLLLELPDGVVLVDHKTYPGGRDTWLTKAAEFGPQFAVYAEALRLAGKRVLEQWVSFAVAGGAVRMVDSDRFTDPTLKVTAAGTPS